MNDTHGRSIKGQEGDIRMRYEGSQPAYLYPYPDRAPYPYPYLYTLSYTLPAMML